MANCHLGLTIGMDSKELRDICLRNQIVHILLGLTQTCPATLFHRGNDRVVGRYFFVIPGPAADPGIGPTSPTRQVCRLVAAQIAQNHGRVRELSFRQEIAIRTRIGGEFFFIQFLRRIQHQLRIVAELPACQHLQRRKRQRQPLRLLLLGGLALDNLCSLRRRSQFRQQRLSHLVVRQAPLGIQARLILRRLPVSGEQAVFMLKIGLDGEVIHQLKTLNLAFPSDDQRQRRRLYPAHRQGGPVPGPLRS